MMMLLSVSVPSLAQKTVQKRINTSTATNQKGKVNQKVVNKDKNECMPADISPVPKSKVQSSQPDVPKQTAETQQTLIPNSIDDFTYIINSNKNTVTITGCNDLNGKVVIPSSFNYQGQELTVTAIGVFAFGKKDNITSVIIPNTVTTIGKEAFYGCGSLTSVVIPNSVTTIERKAFSYCSLTSIVIPNSVKWIEDYAFENCSITSIVIPNSITKIGECTFSGCKSLRSVTIPNSVTRIGLAAFMDCKSLSTIIIPNSVTYIEQQAFMNTNLKSVTIPNSVKKLGSYAFSDNKSLSSASAPDPASLTFIGKGIFEGTPITAVKIRDANGKTSLSKDWHWFYRNDPNAVNNARRQESYSSYSSNSRSSSSSSSSSSNDSEDTYSCTVHLKFKDGDTVYKGSGKVYFKGFLSTGGIKYYTDSKGNATIRWPKSKGKVIDTITLDRNIGFNEAYTKEGLNLEDGGNYTICLDCR